MKFWVGWKKDVMINRIPQEREGPRPISGHKLKPWQLEEAVARNLQILHNQECSSWNSIGPDLCWDERNSIKPKFGCSYSNFSSFIFGWYILPSGGSPNNTNTSSNMGVINPYGKTNELMAEDQKSIATGCKIGWIGTQDFMVRMASQIPNHLHFS